MKKLILVSIWVMVIFSLVYAGDFQYVGVNKCKLCHKGEKKGMVFEKWEKSMHAKALDTLKAKGEDKNPKCLECHVTGFNEGCYKVGAANAADFAGVQCESCHGPGSEYKSMSVMKDKKLAMTKGLIVPNEAVCKKCHNPKSPTFKGFNFKEYAAKIDHTYTKK
ncbi:MAG TPA: cytochrome c family protein [Candidatus Deferrimicrobium sp.]|nr:cytochrome c family protein [Candidatus Deferrimicrobium sp.]